MARLESLAHLLDEAVRIPGLGVRIGLDGLVGLIPGIGDTATALIAGYIVVEGARAGASGGTVARMIGNVLIDYLVGAVPVAGDLFDFAFKANRRNLDLLRAELRPAIDPD